jgi:hypothetical protein
MLKDDPPELFVLDTGLRWTREQRPTKAKSACPQRVADTGASRAC